MSLIRWEPFTTTDDMFNRFPSFGLWPRFAGHAFANLDWSPSVDISETEQHYLIRASLPSVKKEDVEVTFADGLLTLSGAREQHAEEKQEKFHKVENCYGNFSRSFMLPKSVDANAIRAESKDGMLTIRVPKAKTELRKPATIKIQ